MPVIALTTSKVIVAVYPPGGGGETEAGCSPPRLVRRARVDLRAVCRTHATASESCREFGPRGGYQTTPTGYLRSTASATDQRRLLRNGLADQQTLAELWQSAYLRPTCLKGA